MKESYPFFVSHYYKLEDSLLMKFSLLIKKKKANKTLSTFWMLYRKLATYYCCSVTQFWLLATPRTAARQASLSIISQSLLQLMSVQLVMSSNYLILCCPLLLLPSILPSIRVFSKESALHIRWPQYWNFRFNISPSNEYSGLISFRIDLVDLLAVQGTLKNLLQYHISKA